MDKREIKRIVETRVEGLLEKLEGRVRSLESRFAHLEKRIRGVEAPLSGGSSETVGEFVDLAGEYMEVFFGENLDLVGDDDFVARALKMAADLLGREEGDDIKEMSDLSGSDIETVNKKLNTALARHRGAKPKELDHGKGTEQRKTAEGRPPPGQPQPH